MTKENYSIRYPRRVILRTVITRIARWAIKLLSRFELSGTENIPATGPVILAVNHVHVMEVALTVVMPERQVELIGNGDIPFDPAFGWIAKLYGFIPINRGNLDRQGLKQAMDVLHQGGVLGIFPEGGIWDQANMQPQVGVSLIAQRTQTPVIPVACGGMKGAVADLLHFKFPRLSMRFGKALPPPTPSSSYDKAALKAHAARVLAAIQALLPEEERQKISAEESFTISELSFSEVEGANLPEAHRALLAKLLSTPSFLEILKLNLKIPVHPFEQPEKAWNAAKWIAAIDSLLDYNQANPGFFRYRYGIDNALLVDPALRGLKALIERTNLLRKSLKMRVERIRKFMDGNSQKIELSYEILPD